MKLRQGPKYLDGLLIVVLALAGSALAQTAGTSAGPRTGTPAASRVARVQYLAGEVSIDAGGGNHWVAASLYHALPTNTDVWTDKNSRAELNVGDGFIRMNSETSVTLSNVNRSTVQFKVNQGTVSLTVQRLLAGEIYEIDTPNATLTVMKPGVYRVDVLPNENQTWATVRKGTLAATGQGSAVTINANLQDRFREGYSLQHTAEKAPPPDGFEDWASVRDQRLAPPRGPYFGFGAIGVGPWGVVAVPGPYRAPIAALPWVPPFWIRYP